MDYAQVRLLIREKVFSDEELVKAGKLLPRHCITGRFTKKEQILQWLRK